MLVDACLHDLAVVNELLKGSAAGWSGVLNLGSSLVIPLACIQVEELLDGVANKTEVVTKRFQLLIEILTLDLVRVKPFGGAL